MANNNESWIKNELIPQMVSEGKLCKKSESGQKPSIKDVTVESLNTTETFMLTLCYKVKVVMVEDGEEHIYSLVVKKTPKVPMEAYNATSFDQLFSNEIMAYTVVLPQLGDTSKYVKYYYSYRKPGEAIIVLEDFTVKGWRMSKTRYNLSLEHIMLAVKFLGEFHGNAYGLKLSKPEKLKLIISKIVPSRYLTEIPETWNQILTITHTRVCKLLDECSEIPQRFTTKLKDAFKDQIKLYKMMCHPQEPFATICHGDYLRNNIAFKYSEKDPECPIDVTMFDFQTITYCTPMIDMVTLLCMSMGKDLRSTHFDEIFKTYCYTMMQSACSSSGLRKTELPEFLSYNHMLEEFIKYYAYGIRIASFFLMEMVEPLENTPESWLGGEDAAELFQAAERGGETVNSEIRHMIRHLYSLASRHHVDIVKNFEILEQLV